MPRQPERDLSGRVLPQSRSAGIDRFLAVPPVRDRPNDDSTELLIAAYRVIAIGVGFQGLFVDALATTTVTQFDAQYRSRIDSINVFCPDMVTAATPLIYFQINVNGSLLAAWNNVPIWPRTGIASVTFDAAIIVPPGAKLEIQAANLDGAATHFVGVYLRGWQWSKDLVQG